MKLKSAIKTILFVFLILSVNVYGQITNYKPGDIRGLFLDVGVGPRFAVGDFASNHFFASGFEASLSYADDNSLPFFVYGKFNFASFPSEFTDILSSSEFEVSSRFFLLEPGICYFFPPISDKVVLLMPFAEGGVNLGIVHTVHQLNTEIKTQYSTNDFKFGLHLGVGVSMFLLDALITYNYFYEYQYIGLGLRVRIPIFIKL